jgi:mannose-6-phosphate isomerase
MHHCPVHAGETYFIPSGMLHAIGKGILIAEIQQNCDLTYRVYDYERRGADGQLRELHVEKALDVTVPFTEAEVSAIRYEAAPVPVTDTNTLLAQCRYFKTQKLTATEDKTLALSVNDSSFVYLLCTDGEGAVRCGSTSTSLIRGEGVFLPAGLGEVILTGNLTVLAASIE